MTAVTTRKPYPSYVRPDERIIEAFHRIIQELNIPDTAVVSYEDEYPRKAGHHGPWFYLDAYGSINKAIARLDAGSYITSIEWDIDLNGYSPNDKTLAIRDGYIWFSLGFPADMRYVFTLADVGAPASMQQEPWTHVEFAHSAEELAAQVSQRIQRSQPRQ